MNVDPRGAAVNSQLPASVIVHATDRQIGILAAVSATGAVWGGSIPIDWGRVGEVLGMSADSTRAARAAVRSWVTDTGCLCAPDPGGLKWFWSNNGEHDDEPTQWAQVPSKVVAELRQRRSSGALRLAFGIGLCARAGYGWAAFTRIGGCCGMNAASVYRALRAVLATGWCALERDGWRVSTSPESVRVSDPLAIQTDRSTYMESSQPGAKAPRGARAADIDRLRDALGAVYGAEAARDPQVIEEVQTHVEQGTLADVLVKAESYRDAVASGAAVAMGNARTFLRRTWTKWRVLAVCALQRVAGVLAQQAQFTDLRIAEYAVCSHEGLSRQHLAAFGRDVPFNAMLAVQYAGAYTAESVWDAVSEGHARAARLHAATSTAVADRAVSEAWADQGASDDAIAYLAAWLEWEPERVRSTFEGARSADEVRLAMGL